ncbi:hypothetical protein L3Q67_38960 [Saccharothrix sp. AJ9571]|nr:hypothetical protein L3Q67_38960 [Saccharothrix sp. AJ9571]
MARLLAAQDLEVHPDYRMFGIGENATGFGETPPVPGAGWLGVGRASVTVGVMEDNPRELPLRLEHWDSEPPMPEGPDTQHTVCLQLPTGKITIDQVTYGGQDTDLDLVPGLYAARISGWRGNVLRERYLAQFWLLSPTARFLRTGGRQIGEGCDRFAILDRAAGIREVPPSGGRLAVDEALIQVRYDQDPPLVLLELWDGPPLELGEARVHEPFRLRLPSGHLDITQLRPGTSEVQGGAVPLARVPRGDYDVSLTVHTPNKYLFRLWPVSTPST